MWSITIYHVYEAYTFTVGRTGAGAKGFQPVLQAEEVKR
jgi:hypothetical protein